MNPVTAYGLCANLNVLVTIIPGDGDVTWDIETAVDVATCPDCRPPAHPSRTDRETHYFHALFAGLMAWLGASTLGSPEVAFTSVVGILILGAALLASEMYQIGHHKVTSDRDLMYDAWDAERDETADPVEDAREAFLRGEIDEDEFEERLDEELGEEERDRELLTER